jgi:site-specific DNA-cytosine methylase
MKVLVACEYSGTVRDAFLAAGHDATSCDLLPTDTPGPHYQGDVSNIINDGWDLMIAHPPCTHLAVSGSRHFAAKKADGRQQAAIDFFMLLATAEIPRICIENPVCIMSSVWMQPNQTVQPWMFGHKEQKATCLWLKALPLLHATDDVYDEMMLLPKSERERIHYMPPSPKRWKERSKTFSGLAKAMAYQWSNIKQMELMA